MLKYKRIVVALTVIIAVVVASCAEQTYDPTVEFPRESFEAWVKKYDPAAEKKPSGIYIRFVERNPNWHQIDAPILGKSWVAINYTGRTLGHNVFETRNAELSRLIGTWAATTHFVDDFLSYGQSQQLCAGLVDALGYMRDGDSARIYIPANLAYSSSMSVNAGYTSTVPTYANYPVYFDIRLSQTVNDAYQWELKMLDQYALAHGYTKSDSITKGLYMRIVERNPKGDTITSDSTARIRYAAYFFDGVLAFTNNDTIAKAAGYYTSSSSYTVKELNPAVFNSTAGTYLVYPKVVLKMRKGDIAEALAVSWLGPGMSGDVAAKPQMLPYHPLRYSIRVLVDTTKK